MNENNGKPDQQQGLYRKYNVERLNDPASKHKDCLYYVLDLDHDKHAVAALEAYAKSCAEEYPTLAFDLRHTAAATARKLNLPARPEAGATMVASKGRWSPALYHADYWWVKKSHAEGAWRPLSELPLDGDVLAWSKFDKFHVHSVSELRRQISYFNGRTEEVAWKFWRPLPSSPAPQPSVLNPAAAWPFPSPRDEVSSEEGK